MKNRICALIVVITLLLTGCSGKAPKTPAVDITEGLVYDETDNTWSTTDEEWKYLVYRMKQDNERCKDMKGVRILATDDKVIFISGLSAVDKDGKKADAYTTYEIGSVTKMFTATCILQLAERGKLSISDTLDKYFPEFEKGKEITIFDVLHMQAGLEREFFPDSAYYKPDGSVDEDFTRKYYTDGFTDKELLKSLFSLDLLYKPGTDCRYSNAGYILLAMIIEKVSKMSYSKYVQKNIFDVCGMTHTSSMKKGDLTSVPEEDKTFTEFKIGELFGSLYFQDPKTGRGAGDIHSCAADMILFDRALIGGKLINQDSLKIMFDLQIKSINEYYDKKMDYGCGWTTHPVVPFAGGVDVYSHSGKTMSYSTDSLYCKSEHHGNIYLIQFCSAVTDKTNEYMCICDKSIIDALSVKYW